MTRTELAERLLELPGVLLDEEKGVLRAQQALSVCREALTAAENALLLEVREDGSPLVNGKNAETRAAQLWDRTSNERGDVIQAERVLSVAKMHLGHAQAEFAAARSVARLLAGEAD